MKEEDAKEKLIRELEKRNGVRSKLSFLSELVVFGEGETSDRDSVDKEEE